MLAVTVAAFVLQGAVKTYLFVAADSYDLMAFEALFITQFTCHDMT